MIYLALCWNMYLNNIYATLKNLCHAKEFAPCWHNRADIILGRPFSWPPPCTKVHQCKSIQLNIKWLKEPQCPKSYGIQNIINLRADLECQLKYTSLGISALLRVTQFSPLSKASHNIAEKSSGRSGSPMYTKILDTTNPFTKLPETCIAKSIPYI